LLAVRAKSCRAASHARIADGGEDFPPMGFCCVAISFDGESEWRDALNRVAKFAFEKSCRWQSVQPCLANRLTRRTGEIPVRRPDC